MALGVLRVLVATQAGDPNILPREASKLTIFVKNRRILPWRSSPVRLEVKLDRVPPTACQLQHIRGDDKMNFEACLRGCIAAFRKLAARVKSDLSGGRAGSKMEISDCDDPNSVDGLLA